MRHRFTLAMLGFAGLAWAACRDASDPNRIDPDVTNTASVHAEFTFSCVQLACQFTDQSTTDSGTPPVSNWLWTFGDSTTSTDQNPAHAFASPGTYAVTLRAYRSLGLSDSVTHLVTVSNDTINQPPHAAFTFNCSALTCQFFDASTDSDGVIVRWDWEFGDSARDTVPNPVHTYGAPGSYDVFHAVVDNDGLVDSLHQIITVTADTGGGNQPPIANFSFSCTGLACQFTDQSVDSGGSIVRWEWSFGDGATDTVPNPFHAYAAPGSYFVSLVVFDNAFAEDTASQVVTVQDTAVAHLFLEAQGFRVKGVLHANLFWSGGTSDTAQVFRDSVLIATVVGATTYEDNTGLKGNRTLTYIVCQPGNGCSNTAVVSKF
jgi:PKD repeat protein